MPESRAERDYRLRIIIANLAAYGQRLMVSGLYSVALLAELDGRPRLRS
jgi:hypothetical protein